MGRGISQLQKDILGVAFTVNKHTQGYAAVKAGQPDTQYKCPTVDYDGMKDLKTSLVVYTVFGILPSKWDKHGYENIGFFRGTPEYKRAKASASRAITRLIDRGLLIFAPKDNHTTGAQWGYVLTAEGLAIAKDYEKPIPAIDTALKLFGINGMPGRRNGYWDDSFAKIKPGLIDEIKAAHCIETDYEVVNG